MYRHYTFCLPVAEHLNAVSYHGSWRGVGRSFPIVSSAVPISFGPLGAQYWPVLLMSKVSMKFSRDWADSSGVTASTSQWHIAVTLKRRTSPIVPVFVKADAFGHFRSLVDQQNQRLVPVRENSRKPRVHPLTHHQLQVLRGILTMNPGWTIPTATPSSFRSRLSSLPTMLRAVLLAW